MTGLSARARALLALTALAGLAGCIGLPAFRSASCDSAASTAITTSPTGESTTTLDVLIYNIEGLQWPARSGRAARLRAIGESLRRLRERGEAPDIVLFQEAFSPAAVRSVVDTGYPSLASGPSRTQRSAYPARDRLPGRPRPTKGELGFRLMTSGLVIASRYPITGVVIDPYSRRACAGFDCLSNKGVMLATVEVPGVPQLIGIANTHMNARNASRVAPARNLAAHQAQALELETFLADRHDLSQPLILGGDFNMRRSPERFAAFRQDNPLALVHEYCLDNPACEVRMSWDGDAPWLDTQDLQFFASGSQVRVTPIRVEAMFDGSPTSPKLSDHDGFRVIYRLSWSGKGAGRATCASAG
ncbi:metal-dependent hydrolase [Sphingomonas solaris]|uniref:Metal-dependent hydrolase n=1 Tax=Alterirhizorhabdus solaris TaxID=2529389 RepID=A0A558QV72_9SPHN|nr:metal-dependent hydrolase [Sphingomonas solaris]